MEQAHDSQHTCQIDALVKITLLMMNLRLACSALLYKYLYYIVVSIWASGWLQDEHSPHMKCSGESHDKLHSVDTFIGLFMAH